MASSWGVKAKRRKPDHSHGGSSGRCAGLACVIDLRWLWVAYRSPCTPFPDRAAQAAGAILARSKLNRRFGGRRQSAHSIAPGTTQNPIEQLRKLEDGTVLDLGNALFKNV